MNRHKKAVPSVAQARQTTKATKTSPTTSGVKRRRFIHQQDMGKYLDAYRALHGVSVKTKAAARFKTRIVDDALTGGISYQAAERLISQYNLEHE